MVIDQRSTHVAAGTESRDQEASDHEVEEDWSFARIPAVRFSATTNPPAVKIGNENDVVNDGVGDGNLDTRDHSALLLACLILLPWSTVLGDHADQLLVARHDRRNGRDEAGAKEKVGESRNVEEGGGCAEASGEEVRLDIGGGEEVEEIKAPCEEIEGDGEVDECWMDRVAACLSVCALLMRGCDLNTLGMELWERLWGLGSELALELRRIAHRSEW